MSKETTTNIADVLYPKINTLFKRDENNKIIKWDWSTSAFAYLADNRWRMTEKIDGTNIRVIIQPDSGEVSFAGRTNRAQLPKNLLAWLEAKFKTLEMKALLIKEFPYGGILFGEGFGAGIQKGGKYSSEQTFILFDVKVGRWWLEWDSITEIAETLSIVQVPLISTCTLFDGVNLVEKGLTSTFGDFEAEGVVAVPLVPLASRSGQRIIAKIKTKDWR